MNTKISKNSVNDFSKKAGEKAPACMSREDFDRIMAEGLRRAKENDSFDVDDVFAELETSCIPGKENEQGSRVSDKTQRQKGLFAGYCTNGCVS